MSQLSSIKNKELLWNLLLNNGAFNNLSESQLPVIQNDFEALISLLSNDRTELDLIEQNKLFVQQMVQKINNYRQQLQQIKTYEPVKEIYTSQDIRGKKLDEFNVNVQKAQDEFNSVIKLKTPEEINFSDTKEEDKPIDNMEELIQKTIAERNLEVSNINSENLTNPNPDTEKWLNSQDMSKKVSFSENNNEIIESKIEVDDNKFLNLLNEIKKNQIEILDLLKNR